MASPPIPVPLVVRSRVLEAHNAGFRCLSYTVNEEPAAQHLLSLGTEGIITDRVDLVPPL